MTRKEGIESMIELLKVMKHLKLDPSYLKQIKYSNEENLKQWKKFMGWE